MVGANYMKKYLTAFTLWTLTGVLIISTPASALLTIDKQGNDIYFSDDNTCNEESSSVDLSVISPGNGEPNGMTYPNLDAAKMAAAIEKFVKDRAPDGTPDQDIPLHGTGAVAVRSAKKANMSPFLAYAHAVVESSMGFTTVPGAQIKIHEGHNLFGRSATDSQPHVWEGDRNWYKWSSFKASLDSEAEENKGRSSGDWYSYDRDVFSDEIDKGMSAYAHRYAPPDDGNDTAAYIRTMQGLLNEMAESAGGNISTSGLETTGSSSSSSCCANPAAGGSAVQMRDNNPETALGYLMSVGDGQKLTIAQAAGIVGNLQQESGENLDPKATNGTHTGIAQWDNVYRFPKLTEFAKFINADPYEIGTQLRYLAWEITLNNEWTDHKGSYSSALTSIRAVSTPEEAATAFEAKFEKSGGSALDKRQANARALYDKYKDSSSLASSKSSKISGTTASCSSASSGAGKLQEYTLKYAWGDRSHGTERKPEYAAAIEKAESEGRYVGSMHGVDCGGFVTTLVHDSGFDPDYNYSSGTSPAPGALIGAIFGSGSKSSGKSGNTVVQEAWVKANWQALGTANGTYEPDGSKFTDDKLQPGDVAFVSGPGHTWIYVGEIKDFNSKYASASQEEKAPAVAGEGFDYKSARWYRKKGGSSASSGSSSPGSGSSTKPSTGGSSSGRTGRMRAIVE